MDYTNSSGFAVDVLTGNRMHVTSPVPTEVSETDINQITWELMEVIKAAGLTGAAFDKATPASYQKLLTALRSAGVFTTWGVTENSAKVATTAWVRNLMSNASGIFTVNGYQSLPSGLVIQWGQTSLALGASALAADMGFPIAFPNACSICVASIGVNASDYSLAGYRGNQATISVGVPTRFGCNMQAFIPNANTDGRRVQYIAIGY